ncbi:MAG TPA: hypothetical protein VFA94_08785 [Acidimicrobiales bacterium]|nr:hypothetical protein [Acidimicrobiales bacterium]
MKLTEKERRVAFWVAGAAALLSIAFWAPRYNQAGTVLLSLIGVAMAGLLALAARSRSRLLTGGAAMLLTFGPWGFAWVLGAPFLGYAVYTWFGAKARTPPEPRHRAEPQPAAPKERRPPARSKRYTPPAR